MGGAGDEAGIALIAFLDTNVVIRHLTGDPPDQAARAASLLARAERLLLPDLVFAECVFVLESYYGLQAADVAHRMGSLIANPSVRVLDVSFLLRALAIYVEHRLDFANAYVAAAAEASGVGAVASFDRDLDRIDTIRRVEP